MINLSAIKKIYSKDYLILIGIGFMPLLWKMLEIVFLVEFDHALKILGQITLIGIIFKIFEESLLNPLYKILSKENYTSDSQKFYIIKKFLIYYILATLVFTGILLAINVFILKVSKIPNYIFDDTLQFFYIYIVASALNTIAKYLYTCSIISKETKKIGVYLGLKSIATTLLFILFVPKFSVGLGVDGVAIAEIIVNIVAIIYLYITLDKSCEISKVDKREYFKLLSYSLIETLIRNVVYYFVILVFLNIIDNQDLYFVANEYIWSIMLVPVLAQSTIIKQAVSNGNKDIQPYFLNSIILILFMIILIPISILIFKYVYALPNAMDYFYVLLKLFPCYIIFVIDSVIEAYFMATGKLHHILIQSIFTNILVYCTALILYLCGVWNITLNSIILLFNLGVAVSSTYTICAYIYEKRKVNGELHG